MSVSGTMLCTVEVDVADLEDCDLREACDEAARRGIYGHEYYNRDNAKRAYEELVGGRIQSGLAYLERALWK